MVLYIREHARMVVIWHKQINRFELYSWLIFTIKNVLDKIFIIRLLFPLKQEIFRLT